MGWEIPWYTITDSFDADFGVDEWHGTNAFIRDGERVFRTYFINSRGDEAMGSTWSYLDITALGRQEEWEDSPEGYPQSRPYKWWNWHDSYVPERRARPEVGRGVGRRRGRDARRKPLTSPLRETKMSDIHASAAAALGAAEILYLAAAPTFAVMALLTSVLGGPPDALCSIASASPLSGMIPMYLLMSAFHLAPWLTISKARRRAPDPDRHH